MKALHTIYNTLLHWGLIIPVGVSVVASTHAIPAISPWVVLGLESIIMAVLLLFFSLFEREIRIKLSPVTIVLLGMCISLLLSTTLGSENRLAALIHPTGLFSFLFFLPFFLPHFESTTPSGEIQRKPLPLLMVISIITVLTLCCIIFLRGAFPLPTSTLILLLTASIVLVMPILYSNHKRIVPWAGMVFITLVGSLLISLTFYTPDREGVASFLPTQMVLYGSWNEPLSFLIGSGPDRYTTIYTANKPEILNNTDEWDQRRLLASNVFFHTATTQGILGVATLVVLIFAIGLNPFLTSDGAHPKTFRQKTKLIPWASLMVVWLLLLFPSHFLSWTIAFFAMQQDFQSFQPVIRPLKGLLQPMFIASYLIILTILSLGSIGLLQVLRAETHAQHAQQAVLSGDSATVFRSLQTAIDILPFQTSYYHQLANLNQDIALGLLPALEEQSDSPDWYWQQAISAAKKATELEPHSDTVWKDLAAIYNLLSPETPGVTSWQIAAYHTAVALDPTNSLLLISYGDILDALGNTEAALANYLKAITLKPNSSVGYYRLARMYRQHQDYDKSLISYKHAILALPFDSPEVFFMQQELKSLPNATVSTPLPPRVDPVPQIVSPSPTSMPENGQLMGPEEEGFELPPSLQ